MKLYYAPGACSLSPHIVAEEAGVPLELVKVDLKAHKLENGDDYYAVNPKGAVPALVLDDGGLLTEGPAIVQYIADRKPAASGLAPAGRHSSERYKLQEWLTFINGEIHKTFGPLFPAHPTTCARPSLRPSRQEIRLRRKEPCRPAVHARRHLHRRRRLFLRDAALGDRDAHRSLRPPSPNLLRPRRRAPESAGRAEGGSAAEGRVTDFVIARSDSDEAIHSSANAARWIASLRSQ